jgi:signal transduction histidine kinase
MRASERTSTEVHDNTFSLRDDPQSVIIATLAHDMRRHLTVIIGMSETALQRGTGLSEQERTEILVATLRNARRLERLLHDIADVQRFDADGWTLRRTMTNVRTLIDEMVPEFDMGARALTVSGDGPLVDVDADLLRRIIDNLVQNAKQHTPEGSHISVTTDSNSTGSNITVEDDGPGVPDEIKEAVFDAFHSGDVGGSGLGLTLVQRFAAAHGGRAWVEDVPGGGSRFRVNLPAATRSKRRAGGSEAGDNPD